MRLGVVRVHSHRTAELLKRPFGVSQHRTTKAGPIPDVGEL